MEQFQLIEQPPTLEEYLSLRRESGLSPKTPEQGRGAIENSWYFCHFADSETGRAVAMGRVIGDGGWYFHIADMATLPAYQGKGLGRKIIDTLIAKIRSSAPENPYITLIADPPGRRLYEKVGFHEISRSRGMQLPVQPLN
ncbi:N-acetyltransferase [Glutamicibacter uratoxydans]|uniref:N-acetyltransferase n=1 Tax=Glutamicibacter uratoxydans TaxID=43667 RepID=A0A4Y4DTH4_GLUUR|nr:GNAT family N-acetyltransferase [Glutamicibacter uratoxydans]GED06895.1 N-acetyltransferase [Glutamicibacter uratoxydans]